MKYMGSKNRHAKELLPIILKDRQPGQWYVEPFVGGANMIDKVDGNRIGADVHPHLISMWQALQSGWIPSEYTREQYASAKKGYMKSHEIGYIGFNCSYSGKYFGGFAGVVETKGGVRDYQTEAKSNVLKQTQNIDGVVFKCASFDSLEIPPRSIIYCDPPYESTTGYAAANFDHKQFWQWCREKVAQNHQVFVSEYNAPDDFVCVWSKETASSLSANGKVGGNKISIEKLFVHESQLY